MNETFFIEQDIEKLKRKTSRLATIPKNTVVLLGDSITALNGNGDDRLTVGINEYHMNAKGYFTWANALLGQKFKMLYNAGISGNTTTQMLARIQADVIDKKPAYCIILGGTNDLSALASADTVKENLLKIYNTLIRANITVIACTMTPRSDASLRFKILEINEFIKSQKSLLKNFVVCDWYEDVTNPATDNWFSGYSDDGIHPIAPGAQVMGTKLYNVLLNLNSLKVGSPFGGSNVSDTKNLIPNPYSLGGTTLAPSWQVQTTATYTATKIARANGLEWQQIENTGAVATIMLMNIVSTGFVAGDKVSGYIEYEIDDTATNIDCYFGRIWAWGTGNAILIEAQGLGGWTIGYAQTPTKGIIYIPRFTIPEGTLKLNFMLSAKLTGKFRVGRTRLIKE